MRNDESFTQYRTPTSSIYSYNSASSADASGPSSKVNPRQYHDNILAVRTEYGCEILFTQNKVDESLPSGLFREDCHRLHESPQMLYCSLDDAHRQQYLNQARLQVFETVMPKLSIWHSLRPR